MLEGLQDVHVLIVDEEGSSNTLRSYLSSLGIAYTTFDVLSDEDILKVVGDLQRLDAIFVDLDMLEISGYVIRSTIEEHAVRDKPVPIVAYSGHISDIGAAILTGFHSFISKSLSLQYFENYIGEILDGKPVWSIR